MSTSAARLIGGRGYPRLALDWMASEHPGKPLATAAIADKLGIWLSDVHSTMYNLVAAGYIDKIVDPADARRTLYAITATGVEHSKLLSQLPAVAPVKLGAVHRRHKAKVLALVEGDGASAAAVTDAEAPAGEPAPAPSLPQALGSVTGVTIMRQPNGEWVKADVELAATEPRTDRPRDDYGQVLLEPKAEASGHTIGPATPGDPDAVDLIGGGVSTDQTPDDDAAGDAQPETRQHARLAHKMGRPLFAISPTGEVRVLLPRPGLSVYLAPDVLHKLAAASALVRQAGGLA
jgi:DNA-binding MarR family transcriptional regulator